MMSVTHDSAPRGNIVTKLRGMVAPMVREAYPKMLRAFWGMDIGERCHISTSARLDKVNPKGIHIGDDVHIAFEAVILTHDFVSDTLADVHIGRNCLIGARAVIFPGVTIGEQCIVAIGSVVMKSMPANSVIQGNPARVVETGVELNALGRRRPVPAHRVRT